MFTPIEIPHLQDIRQTNAYARYMRSRGWRVETRSIMSHQTYVYIKRIRLTPFYVAKVLRYHSRAVNTSISKPSYTLIFKDEPLCLTKQHNGRIYFKVDPQNTWPVTPTKTLWLDISQTKINMLKKMQQKTRYNLKKAQKSKLITRVISGYELNQNDLNAFYTLWSRNKPFNWLFRPQFNELKSLVESFGTQCFFVFVYKPLCFKERHTKGQGELLAACLILTSKNMAFYWHNASSPQGKALYAPTLCVWEAIQVAKRNGLKVFDFEGLWDERFPKLNRGWKGFSHFKEGFAKT